MLDAPSVQRNPDKPGNGIMMPVSHHCGVTYARVYQVRAILAHLTLARIRK